MTLSIVSCILWFAFFCSKSICAADPRILVPNPMGQYAYGVTTASMIDNAREDPFGAGGQARAVLVSMYYPVKRGADCEPKRNMSYLPTQTAAFEATTLSEFDIPNGTLQQLSMQVCRADAAIAGNSDDHPLVVISPGFGSSRLFYSAIAAAIASVGYKVVSIDHPYDGAFVEFPDGAVALGKADLLRTQEMAEKAVGVRAGDVSFLLDQLVSLQVSRQLIPGSDSDVNVTEVGMVGHSLGGATAASAMANDRRIAGAVNMDGKLYGKEVIEGGLGRPFLIIASSALNSSEEGDTLGWTSTLDHSRDFKLQLKLAGSQHATFSDFALLAQAIGYRDTVPKELVDTVLGTIDGVRSFKVITTYIIAFLDQVLRHKETALLSKPDERYPEITFESSVSPLP
ncbi:MAG: hypothetical protein M1833_003076 [Piccolia ochrophora]|nr:MAG: hypothetical protein M1833_003076 [Piccolia ochrophora]